MAKRFTDTEIWDRDWFNELTPTHKCFVKFVFDKCDIAGFWKPNIRLASICIGVDVTINELINIDTGRQFKLMDSGRVFIPDFIKFQYGKLSMSSRVHKAVADILIKYNLSHLIEDYLADDDDILTAKRKRVTQKKKDQIFSQDFYTCQYCGNRPEKYELNIDHILAVHNGGDNEDDNLITICATCNSKKSDMDVFDFLDKYKKAPLNNLSIKLHTLSKVLDRAKDKEKDKDKDKDVYIPEIENFYFEENIPEEPSKMLENMIIQEMMQIWMKHNPKYQKAELDDFPALLKIAYRIAEAKKYAKHEVTNGKLDAVCKSWEKIVSFIKNDKFFRKLELYKIERQWTGLFQAMDAEKNPLADKTADPTKVKIILP